MSLIVFNISRLAREGFIQCLFRLLKCWPDQNAIAANYAQLRMVPSKRQMYRWWPSVRLCCNFTLLCQRPGFSCHLCLTTTINYVQCFKRHNRIKHGRASVAVIHWSLLWKMPGLHFLGNMIACNSVQQSGRCSVKHWMLIINVQLIVMV